MTSFHLILRVLRPREEDLGDRGVGQGGGEGFGGCTVRSMCGVDELVRSCARRCCEHGRSRVLRRHGVKGVVI